MTRGEPEILLHVDDGECPALVPLGMSAEGGDRQDLCLRLKAEAESLGLRAAAVGVRLRGGAGLVLGDPEQEKSPELFRRIARAAGECAGTVYLTQGFGMAPEDMVALHRVTNRVLGLPRGLGGSGDPSPHTAQGVLASIRACVGDLSGARIAVLGVGRVGSRLVRMLIDCGASVTLADLDVELAEQVAAKSGARAGPVESVTFSNCDVLTPNGRGPVLTADAIPRLRCRYVAGAGSGQAPGQDTAGLLAERGIGYVPESIAGSGWLMNLYAELLPGEYEEGAALGLVSSLEQKAADLLAHSGPEDRE